MAVLLFGYTGQGSVLAFSQNTQKEAISNENNVIFKEVKDLNGDKIIDSLQVIEKHNGERILKISLLNKNGNITREISNNNIIPCKKCGGPSEEETSRLVKIYKNGFLLKYFMEV
ncbi:hypothetical protein [Neisseria sp.]|uniref:hypothetical protein n=1 Tax=Neisseria sp. TaxID=192066 RepID=UPI00359FF233